MNFGPEKPKLVSLFTGAGGLDLGLEQAGFETAFASEIEPYACESLRANRALRSLPRADFDAWFESQVSQQRCYRSNSDQQISALKQRLARAALENSSFLRRTHIQEGDVRALEASTIFGVTGARPGQIDLIAGGPPCQPFSRAGKRRLVECDDGQLFRDFVRLVEGVRPRFFLFENVKGLLQHRADVVSLECRACALRTIADFSDRDRLRDMECVVVDCPACRDRVGHSVLWESRRAGSLEIIENEFAKVGYVCQSMILNAADYGAPQARERLFLVGSRDGERITWPTPTHYDPAEGRRLPSVATVVRSPGLKPWASINQALFQQGHWRYGRLDQNKAVLWVKNVVRPHDEPVTWPLHRPAPTIGAHQAAKLAIAPDGVPEEQLQRQQWHILGRRQGDTAPVAVEHEYLTDGELLALQTFPPSWYLHGTRMQRAFQIGNAVPPILGRVLGEAILTAAGVQVSTRDQGDAAVQPELGATAHRIFAG